MFNPYFEKYRLKFSKLTRGLIIPHAGKQYSGSARSIAFKYTPKDIEYLIYIAALHHLDDTNCIYVLEKNNYYNDKLKYSNLPFKYDQTIIEKEHSYQWVESELKRYYHSNVKILVIAPTRNSNIDDLVDWLLDIYNDKTLLIATTDLTHFGKDFKNSGSLKYPQQISKIQKEENLLYHIINTSTELINNNICGPYSILTFIKFAKKIGWLGRVVDYYDSHSISKIQNNLNKYEIDIEIVKEFVSYVSIIFGKYPTLIYQKLLPIDIYLSLGLFKSIIKFQKYKKQKYLSKFRLPIWSILYLRKNGIFMGTSYKNKTNCCVGQFETNDNSITNINKTSSNCWRDANIRWNKPYNTLDIDKLTYKIDILDSLENWKKHPSSAAKKYFKLNGKYGMELTLRGNHSATFIPIVAKENDWDINTYMRHLTLKAYRTHDLSKQDDWKKSGNYIKIYSSKNFSFNTIENRIF